MRYEGTEIKLDAYGMFCIDGSEKTYETYAKAKDAVDRAKAAKAKVKKEVFEIPAIDSELVKRTITGIHSHSGRLLAKPPVERFPIARVYFEFPCVVAKLQEADLLEKKANALREDLEKFLVPDTGGYRFDPSKYPDAVAELLSAHKAATKLAGKLP